MAKSKLPRFRSLDDLVKFFDTHDLGDNWRDMPKVQFEVDLKRRTHLIALDQDLTERVTAIAKAKRTSSKSLINKWVREKVLEQSKLRPPRG